MRDEIRDTTASRRGYLETAGGVGAAGLAGLACCLGGDGPSTGTPSTTVTARNGTD
jgi:hypothetical protein